MEDDFLGSAEDRTSGSIADLSCDAPVPGQEAAESWRRYGQTLLVRERYADACVALKRAIEMGACDAGVHYCLGIALSGVGRTADAVESYKRALRIRPDSPEVLNNLGSILEGMDRSAEAGACFERAIEVAPQFTTCMNNLAFLRFKQGRLSDAASLFRRILALQPDSLEVLNNLGMVLYQLGDFDESIALFMRALPLRADRAEACNRLGDALAGCGRRSEAVEFYRDALRIRPDYPEALNNLGGLLRDGGGAEEAEGCFQRAVEIDPRFTPAIKNLAFMFLSRGRLDEAAALCRRALSMEPDCPETWNNLGNVLKEQGKPADAGDCYMRALAVDPRYVPALNNLGVVRCSQGRLDEAAALYRGALSVQPDLPEVLSNLSVVLRLQNAVEESAACCRRALAVKPDSLDAIIHLNNSLRDLGRLPEAISILEDALARGIDSPGLRRNLGMLLLAVGRYEDGWREYEWRWKCPDVSFTGSPPAQRIWRGEPAEDKVLLLYAEQGFGDTIQFCRYAPLVAERCRKVVLMVQPELVRLLGSLPGVDRVVAEGQPLPAFDLQCPLLSLPLSFGTRLENIPADIPYLAPDEESVLEWRERLSGGMAGCLKVGLVWAGCAHERSVFLAARDKRRSISPEILAPLLGVPDVGFYSLQKVGPPVPAGFEPIDFMSECRDFADTAALISNLDLVISVDTAVVHLAGALGKPVWVLNRFDTCWRWLQDREDSPWYPTLRLFRQPRLGDWESVVALVQSELERYSAQHLRGKPVGDGKEREE